MEEDYESKRALKVAQATVSSLQVQHLLFINLVSVSLSLVVAPGGS